MMRCAIWYHLCNLKNVKGGVSVIEECKWRSVNFRKVAGFSHEGVLLLVKLQVLPNRATHHIYDFRKKFFNIEEG